MHQNPGIFFCARHSFIHSSAYTSFILASCHTCSRVFLRMLLVLFKVICNKTEKASKSPTAQDSPNGPRAQWPKSPRAQEIPKSPRKAQERLKSLTAQEPKKAPRAQGPKSPWAQEPKSPRA
jgi:hypothetical protein